MIALPHWGQQSTVLPAETGSTTTLTSESAFMGRNNTSVAISFSIVSSRKLYVVPSKADLRIGNVH